jgi:hypothetical protein
MEIRSALGQRKNLAADGKQIVNEEEGVTTTFDNTLDLTSSTSNEKGPEKGHCCRILRTSLLPRRVRLYFGLKQSWLFWWPLPYPSPYRHFFTPSNSETEQFEEHFTTSKRY